MIKCNIASTKLTLLGKMLSVRMRILTLQFNLKMQQFFYLKEKPKDKNKYI